LEQKKSPDFYLPEYYYQTQLVLSRYFGAACVMTNNKTKSKTTVKKKETVLYEGIPVSSAKHPAGCCGTSGRFIKPTSRFTSSDCGMPNIAAAHVSSCYLRGACIQSWYRHCCKWAGICAFLAEFFGTAILTFALAFTAAQLGVYGGSFTESLVLMAVLAWALLWALIEMWKMASGGHFNPGVTITMWLLGKICWKNALVYILLQMLGGIVGALFAWLFLGHCGESIPGCLGTPTVGSGGICMAFLAECLACTFFYIAVYYHVIHATIPAAAIGAALAVAHILFLGISGASLNFARYLGPYLFSHCWCWSVWLYFLSSIVIGPLFAFLYVKACQCFESRPVQDSLPQ